MDARFRKAMKLVVAAAIAIGVAASTAIADVGFFLPSAFQIGANGRVTAIASFSDRFPDVEHPLRSHDFHILSPTGERVPFDAIHELEQMTVLYATLDAPGVYRLSSGERLGRKGQAAQLADGAYMRLGEDGVDPAELPAAATILSSQTATVSEVYVRCGAVDALETLATSGRLSIQLEAGKGGFRSAAPIHASVRFDGAPIAGEEIVLIAPYDAYRDQSDGVTSTLDENGLASLTPNGAGPHVVLVRHIAEAPVGAETDLRSYSTALVIEISPAAESD